MNPIDSQTLQKANDEAIYNVYICLADKTMPQEGEILHSVVRGLEAALSRNPRDWKDRDKYRLQLLKNAISTHPALGRSAIGNLTRSQNGLTACSFTKPSGAVSVVFRGTGSGEWIDNGEGLSGIPEENTYLTYGPSGKVLARITVQNDYATDQQVEALNWFRRIAAKNGWSHLTELTVSGHSKGGNKAQFVAIHADIVDACYSFDGQGFSPEALAALRKQYGAGYEDRRRKIHSLATDNDYVNVLGERLMPEAHIYFFRSWVGLHYMEALLDNNGQLHRQSEQGKLSRYIESVSKELMRMPPAIRQYATLGVMNLFQKYVGEGMPVNGDAVSIEKTIAGIGVALGPLLYHLRGI